MSKARTILLPSQTDGWEVWSCGSGGCTLKKAVATPGEARVAGAGTVVGVPGRHCRTIGMALPSQDPTVLRKMAFSQLERRGLAHGSIKDTLFDCHPLPDSESTRDGDDTSVSVDVLSELPDGLELSNARGYTAAIRLFPLPKNRLLLWQEQGQLNLSAARDGRLVHSQVIGPASRINNGAAQEINLTRIALEDEGLIDDSTDGLVVWGDYTEDDLAALRTGLDMPVELKQRPNPSAELASRETAGQLVPDSVHATRARHRRTWIVLCLIIALAMGYLVVLYRMKRGVEVLEAQIPQLEQQVNQTKDVAERVKQAQARWNTLRPVLETKRYPLVHLSHIARVMPGGGVRISDFESKIKEVKIKGEARDAASAYQILRLLQADSELNVYNWSMPQPSVKSGDRATFEINGKLR